MSKTFSTCKQIKDVSTKVISGDARNCFNCLSVWFESDQGEMLDVTVKTLDGRNRSFSVPDEITVKEFKEKIAGGIEISADTQRLIFQGRVLQDDKKLNDYDVNGKTLHVVQKPPPGSRTTQSQSQSSGASTTQSQSRAGLGSTQTFVGSFRLPSNMVDANQVQNIVQNVLSGMGDVGRNARISTRSADDGSAVDVHIHLGQVGSPALQSQSSNRLRVVSRMLRLARQALNRLENPGEAAGTEDPMDTSPSDSVTTETAVVVESVVEEGGDVVGEGADALLSETVEVQLEEVFLESVGQPEDQPPVEAESDSQPPPEPATQPQATPSSSQAESRSTNSTSTTTSTASTGSTASSPPGPQHPRLPALADILQEVATLNQRLQPHLEGYQTFLRDDPTFDSREESTAAQRLHQNVSEVLHCLGHIYHNMSDLMVDTQQSPPRVLRATPVAHPTAVIQQTIPVQAQINVAHVSPQESPHLPRRTTTPASSSTPTSTAASTATAASTGPNLRPGGPFAMRLPMPGRGIPSTRVQGSLPQPALTPFGPGGQPMMFMRFGSHRISSSTAPNGGSQTMHMSSGTPPSSQQGAAPTGQQGAAPTGQQGAAPTAQQGAAPTGQQGAAQPGMPPFLPQNFLQNVMQMAQQAASGQLGGQQVFLITQGGMMPAGVGTPITASSNTSSTHTSTATSTPQPTATIGGSQAPQGTPQAIPIPMSGLPPGFPPVLPFSNPVDPYLMCQSRFFLQRQASAAASQAGSQAASQTAANMAGTVSNLISSLMSQNLPGGVQIPSSVSMGTPVTRSSTAPPTQPSVVTSASSAAPAGGAPEPPSIQALRAMLQAAAPATSESASQSQSGSGSSQAGEGAIGVDMFTQLVRGVGNYMSQAAMGEQASDSIYDFINTLGHDASASGEGLLSDIFMCVSRHLTIVDLMGIFCNQTAPLQRLVGPLQVFIREKVLLGEEDSTENIDSSVERMTEEMLPQIEEMSADARVRDNIDYPASIQELLRSHLCQLCRLILNASESDPDFGSSLYTGVRLLMNEFLVLSRCCMEEGTSAVERLVQSNVHRITSEVNPMIQQWMTGMAVQNVRTMYTDVTVTDSQIQQYIVRRADPERSSTRSSDASFVSADGGDDLENAVVEPLTATEVPGCDHNKEETMEVDSEVTPSPVRNHDDRQPHIDPAIVSRLPPPPTASSSDHVPVTVGSESWHSQVPQEWVSVITNDVHRQQRQPKQPPFSDAYLNGMPAKRRKLMSKSVSSDELNEPQKLLPEAVQRAAQAVGAEPISSPEEVARDAGASTTLRESFQHEMADSIRKRIEDDSDYIPEKYPNSEKFYKGQNK